MRFLRIAIAIISVLMCTLAGSAQQTNPVERQVSNPITDTPNINPISVEQDISAPRSRKLSFETEGGGGELVVYATSQSVEGPDGKRILTYTGNVDARYGIYRMQADKITIYEAEDRLVAEGSVIFDQGDDQRITGARAVWNISTKLGVFEDSTGFTNQTNDGTVMYFTADRVERTSLDTVVVTHGKFTSCDASVPKWSFTADEAEIKANDRVKLKGAKFRIKDIPILPLPFASIPIRERDRSSGFLTPSFSYSPLKGYRLTNAYFQTLGRSADVTFRADIFSKRGIGYGLEARTRANSRSFFDFGFYAVKDRILGPGRDAQHPDQGGTSVFAEGVHFFPNGFTASVDIRLTSSLAFRQVFSDGIQQIISPLENSQVFVNKSWDNYTINFLTRSQVVSIPNARIKSRNLPSINLEKRPSEVSFLKGVYFSFRTALEGVSRSEEVDNLALHRKLTGGDPVVTPSVVQRFDAYPEISIPLQTKYFNFTVTGAMRVTHYSNSFGENRTVLGREVTRKYGEFTFDVRPVALARNFYGKGDEFKFRHVIEPFVSYRLVKGVDNFNRIIRFDEIDTITNTNEIEFGVTNRIYTRRFSEAVTNEAQARLQQEAVAGGDTEPLSVQPYELFTVTVRGKYFFDKTFGGALIPGQRNQIEPITALSFYTFGGVPRRFSPLNIDATYRPQRTIFVNTRTDVGLDGDSIRAASATVGYQTPLLRIFQTFFYTRAVELVPSLAKFANEDGKEAGTLRGSQWSPSVFVGNRNKGPFGGASFFFDFENRRETKRSPLISSVYTGGWATSCCSVAVQYTTLNVGVRNENRIVFTFRLNGIGTIGTDQIGQGIR